MTFQETKTETGYNYFIVDVFGKATIKSTTKLNGSILDDIVVFLLKQNLKAETITGKVKHKTGEVEYTFKRAPLWEDPEPEEDTICQDTPTSTKKQDKGSTVIIKLTIPGLSWLRKFAVAFREAYKKTK